MSGWASIYGPLKARFPEERYHFNKTLLSYEKTLAGVSAHFADGTTARADLLIGADGLRSAVRTRLCRLSLSFQQFSGDIQAAPNCYDRLRGEFGRRCVARGRYVGS